MRRILANLRTIRQSGDTFHGLLVVPFVAICLALSASPTYGHDEHEEQGGTERVPDAVIHRPTAVPDRLILTWNDDPATTQSLTWRTSDDVEQGVAEFSLAGPGPNFVDAAKRVRAQTTPVKSDRRWVAHYHTAVLTELQPETKYAYRVGDGINWSEWSHFVTASREPKPFTFIYFGDSQTQLKSHWSRVVREAFRDAPRAAFMLHAGDLVNRANRDADWGDWHNAAGFIHRTIPCIATTGNHEYRVNLSRYWQPGFAFPENGPEKLRETVYYLDYQCARIVSLNSNEYQQEQVAWLENVLTSNPLPWSIITFHHPMYSSAEGRDNSELRAMWMPTFDKHRVDIVLQGHDHTYARSRLLTVDNVENVEDAESVENVENVDTGAVRRKEPSGTMYVVSVSGPKMYRLQPRPFMRRMAQDTQLYQIIHVHPDRLEYEARTATGEPYDAFTLVKRLGERNELVERAGP